MVIRKFGDDCILIPSRQGVGDLESIYRPGWLRHTPYTPSPIPIIRARRTPLPISLPALPVRCG